MERIKVAVSPFYGGENWTDEATQISFEKNPRGLNVYSIPEGLDLSGVRKAIRLNSLILVEGNIGEHNEVEEIVIDEPKTEKAEEPKEEPKDEPVAEEPKEEPVVEAKEEAKEEPKEEAVKPAPKRATKKKASSKK